MNVPRAALIPDPRTLWALAASIASPVNAGIDLVNKLARTVAAKVGIDPSSTENLADVLQSPEVSFMKPDSNPYTEALESSGGRGLAGVLTSLQFSWAGGSDVGMWETDWNSRAPMSCKITAGFTVIHDIAPGIDSAGLNRAPIYNVGDTMNAFSGDQYSDNGEVSKNRFVAAASNTSNKNRGIS